MLAPMSGVTDLPFRKLARRYDAGLVVSEMVASRELAHGRHAALLRTRGKNQSPFVIQLSGREAYWMGEGAKIAADLGAHIIDINMGCPAKKVTRGMSGSALMRDEDHALSLIEAVVKAVDVPVTLKMRMGWDHDSLNAPSLSIRAESAGIRMITIHGRTRCQFFKGAADWEFIAKVKAAVKVPVIANGDVRSAEDANRILRISGADGVMIGRGAYGRPWLPGHAGEFLRTGIDHGDIALSEQKALALEHYEEMLLHYGQETGLRVARKHLGWYVGNIIGLNDRSRQWLAILCRTDDPRQVKSTLADFYDQQLDMAA